MNQVNNNQKDQVLKTLAIVGFVAVVIFGVWLAVQIVSLMPQAFSSLASIADGVYNYKSTPTEITVVADTNETNAGDSFQVSWNDMQTEGVYTFSYSCTEGVSVEILTETGNTVVPCGETVVIGDNLTTTMVTVSSERQRISEVDYTVSFVKSGDTESLALANKTIRIVNPSIPEGDVVASTDTEEETSEPEDTTEETSEPEVSTPVTPAVTPGPPRVIETVTYTTPTSDPNGRVDLAIRLVAVGHLTSGGDFVARSNMDEDARGAFQFEVKNIGTKTSDEWDFIADLTSGKEYNAPLQKALKPQERVVFTLGYDNVGNSGIREIGVRIRGGKDTNSSNNSFTWAVSVVE